MNRIADLRKKAGYSQATLGKHIGRAQNTICNWENGNREPDNESLIQLAQLFNVSIDYLLGYTDDPHSGTKKQAAETDSLPKEEITEQVISLFRKMNARERREFLSLALHEFDEQLQEEATHEPDKPDS